MYGDEPNNNDRFVQEDEPQENPFLKPWIIIILAVVILGEGGYLAWYYTKGAGANPKTETVTPTIPPTVADNLSDSSITIPSATPSLTATPKISASPSVSASPSTSATPSISASPSPSTFASASASPTPTPTTTQPALKSGWQNNNETLNLYHQTSIYGNSVDISFFAKTKWKLTEPTTTKSYRVYVSDSSNNELYSIVFLTPADAVSGVGKDSVASDNILVKTPTGNYVRVNRYPDLTSDSDWSYIISSLVFR